MFKKFWDRMQHELDHGRLLDAALSCLVVCIGLSLLVFVIGGTAAAILLALP